TAYRTAGKLMGIERKMQKKKSIQLPFVLTKRENGAVHPRSMVPDSIAGQMRAKTWRHSLATLKPELQPYESKTKGQCWPARAAELYFGVKDPHSRSQHKVKALGRKLDHEDFQNATGNVSHNGRVRAFPEKDLRTIAKAEGLPVNLPRKYDATAGTNGHSKYPGHVRKSRGRGPAPNPEREAVLEYCYDEYIGKHRPMNDVFEDCRGRFGERYAA